MVNGAVEAARIVDIPASFKRILAGRSPVASGPSIGRFDLMVFPFGDPVDAKGRTRTRASSSMR